MARIAPRLVVALGLLAAAAPLPAQSLEGVLLEQGSGRALEGALVVLLDSSGAGLRRTMTDAAGRFTLQAPRPGAYRIRADRIGYERTLSPVLELAAGQSLAYRMEVAVRGISLVGIDVSAGRRCQVRPAEGLETARVWEEARKALDASAWAQESQLFRYETVRFTRSLEPERLRVLEERMRSGGGYQLRPFASIPAEELAESGFVRAVPGGKDRYFAPDAEVLLSDAFLDTHCMRLVEGRGEAAGMVGVAFEPVPGRNVPGIRGTFWLDRESATLRFLEFAYSGLSLPVRTDRIGGRVDFEVLPGGAWIVRRWSIRTPHITRATISWLGEEKTEYRLSAIQEEGAEVTRIRTASGDEVGRRRAP